jgi:hypothetical protein
MGEIRARRWCPVDERPVLAVKGRPSHVLHLILSVLTLGLWLVVWLGMSIMSETAPYRCPMCGAKTRSLTMNWIRQRVFGG